MNTQYNLAIRKPSYIFADIIDINDQAVKNYIDKNNVGEGEELFVELQAIGAADHDNIREINIVFRGIIQYDSSVTILDMIKYKVNKDRDEKLSLIDDISLKIR